MLQEKYKLEFIIPVYNEEACLDELVKRLLALREKMPELRIDFVFINDGSTDRSLELLDGYAKEQDCIKIINFTRNFGHQAAITAGIDYADADYAAIIDADLQDPPELIEQMYKKAEEGFDIVYGKRTTRDAETWLKKITAALFYKFLNQMCDVEIPQDTGDFRLISRRALAVLKQMKEKHKFIRGMVAWTGYKSTPFLYRRTKRYAGKTKYTFRKMINFALDAIFSFSILPLRAATYVGIVILELGVFGALFLLYLRFFTRLTVPGITAVIATVVIIGGVQIIMLGVIGEYLGRIFEESKHRPLYIISDVKNITNSNLS